MNKNQKFTVGIIGGGPAGFFSAINLKEKCPEAEVILLEATRRVLTKVKISGGGRCNVTHKLFDPLLLSKSYPRGEKELRQGFHHFQPRDTLEWFKARGVEIKAEKDGRMFPTTNKSDTIIDCLIREAKEKGVQLELGKKVISLKKEKSLFEIGFQKDEPLFVDKVVLATGSSPLGHKLTSSLGHKIIDPMPSLFTFNIKDPLLEEMMGQSFEEVSLELSFEKKRGFKKYKMKGPLLITHWGLSGPAVLKLSAFGARDLFKADYKARLKVNFLGEVKTEACFQSLLEMKERGQKDLLSKITPFGLTKRFWAKSIETCGLKSGQTWQELSKKHCLNLAESLCSKTFVVDGKGVFKEEFVTAGGVCLSEVDFKTMESRLVSSLYFSGEVLNVDGITGGFNFQNAWTTGWLISEALSEE